MKIVAITQRIDINESFKETRDSIDQRWTDFLLSIDILPIFVPNNLEYVEKIINRIRIDGVIFSGGGDLSKYGGDSYERDLVESFLLNWSIDNNIPLLGICRGMQFIQNFFGIPLEKIDNNVNKMHQLHINKGLRLSQYLDKYTNVNSYHNYASKIANSYVLTVATSLDGSIEAIEHSSKNIFGIMWHPERSLPFREEDKNMILSIFNK